MAYASTRYIKIKKESFLVWHNVCRQASASKENRTRELNVYSDFFSLKPALKK